MPSKNSSHNTSKRELLQIQSNQYTLKPTLLSVLILLQKLLAKKNSRERDTFEARCRLHRRETVPNRRKMLSERSWLRKTTNKYVLELLELWWLIYTE